jgi:hypothetical protein
MVRMLLKALTDKHVSTILLGAVVAGCTLPTPKENFANFMNAEIGRPIDQLHDKLMDSRRLPNGNVESKYDYSNRHGRCVYFREIDRKTGRVIGWRTEGDDSGCLIVP